MLFELTISIIIFLVLIISASWVLTQARKKKKQLFDFYAMFLMGFFWAVLGVILKNNVLITTGVLFTITGLYHKKEWDKEFLDWHRLERHEKREIIDLLIILFFLFLLGIVGFLMVKGFL